MVIRGGSEEVSGFLTHMLYTQKTQGISKMGIAEITT